MHAGFLSSVAANGNGRCCVSTSILLTALGGGRERSWRGLLGTIDGGLSVLGRGLVRAVR